MVERKIEYLYHDDVKLALHSWVPSKISAVLFYIHGIQSHAQWLFETGPQIASSSIAVYVLDRRGSGLSQGLRGDIPSSDILLKDYYLALQMVKQKYAKYPLTLLGHSLGGSILAGLLTLPNFDISYDSIVMCASALGKMHGNLSAKERELILSNRSLDFQNLNILDSDYTDDIKFLKFIKNDQNCCRSITARTKAALLEIEAIYLQKKEAIRDVPSVYVYPRFDPLVNTNEALNVFMNITNNRGITIQLPEVKHYLWFTKQRHFLINWISHYILTAGREKTC